jgi:O-antigen/teichoic acid export membrane protein
MEENALRIPPPDRDLTDVDLAGGELRQGALFNTITLVAANFRSIFTFLVARLLGAAALGVFSVAWATTDLFSKIGIFGLDDTITTFIARSEAAGNRVRSRALFRTTVIFGITLSLFTTAIVVGCVRFFGERLGFQQEMISPLAVLLCAMPGIALYRISNGVSRGMKIMHHDIYSRGITDSVATTIAFLIVFLLGFRLFAPEIAAVAGSAASGIVAFAFAARLFRDVPSESTGASQPELGPLLGYAFPIGAYQFLNALILRIDVIMLGWFIDRAPGVTLTTVGIYGVALGIANSLRRVNHAFNPIFAPIMAEMTATGAQERAAATYARLAQWMLWLLLPALAVMIFAGDFILWLYGAVFRQGSGWLCILALACAIEAYVGFGETIIMVQRPSLNLLNSIITCVIAAVANILLIPRFGVTGAAFGILIPYFTQGVLRFFALRFVFKWRSSWRNIAPPVIAAVIAFLPALALYSFFTGISAQILGAGIFLILFGACWKYHSRRAAVA